MTDQERIMELEAQLEHDRAVSRRAVDLKVGYIGRLEAQVDRLKKAAKVRKKRIDNVPKKEKSHGKD